MAKLAIPINQKSLVAGGKVALSVGGGALLAQAGSELAKRASTSIQAFAVKSTLNEAIVDAGAGLALGGAGLYAYGKFIGTPSKAVQLAPFVLGGALMSAAAPYVAPKIVGFIVDGFAKLLPAPAAAAPVKVGTGESLMLPGDCGCAPTSSGLRLASGFRGF